MVFTPWEVKGEINYADLVQRFGLQVFKTVPKPFDKHCLFRRGIVFAHRDFGQIVSTVGKKKFAMLTGLMPSGRFHFGHKLVLDQIIFYQSLGAKIYVTVADIEAYNTRLPDLNALRKTAVEEYLLNYAALGLDLDKCDFYFQSLRCKDGVKASAYYRLAGLLARHATLNEFRAIYGDINQGKMTSALLQVSDILHPQLPEFEGALPVIVPVGAEQEPHLRLTRDLAQRMKEYNFLQTSSTYHALLPGLKGGKMSSSDEFSYIALTDSTEEAARKIKKYAFSGGQETIEDHRKKGGNPDIDVSFQLLRFGLEQDDKKLEEIRTDYKSGALLSGELKQITIEKLTRFLEEHQKKRKKAGKTVEKFIGEYGF